MYCFGEVKLSLAIQQRQLQDRQALLLQPLPNRHNLVHRTRHLQYLQKHYTQLPLLQSSS